MVFKENIQEIIEILSAAKTPQKEEKGNGYVDVINMHVPDACFIKKTGKLPIKC